MKTGTALLILAAAVLVLAVALAFVFQPRLTSAPAPAIAQPQIAGSAAPVQPGVSAAQAAKLASDPSGSLGTKGIVVVGMGTVQVAPDVAYVTAGTQTRAATAKEAQDQNNAAMAAILAAVKKLNIAEKDIQTGGISLSPVIQGNDNKVTGYEASNTITVRVQDITQVGPVLDATVAAGANSGVSIRFGLKDPDGPYRQALAAASQSAQGNAAAIAKAMGVQLGAVQSAVEESVNMPAPVEAVGMGVKAAPSAATPVQPGEISITARLRITYAY